MYINNVEVFGLNTSVIASGYPMRIDIDESFNIKKLASYKDETRAIKLANTPAGSGHANYRKGIIVQFDLCISNKAWVEAERYKFLDFVSSCSTMHKITQIDIKKSCNKYVWKSTIDNLEDCVARYNAMDLYDRNSHEGKELYLEILYNVPAGFELVARMTTNYEQLATIYRQRKNHRLPDWHMFCNWIETLPMFEDLIKSK